MIPYTKTWSDSKKKNVAFYLTVRQVSWHNVTLHGLPSYHYKVLSASQQYTRKSDNNYSKYTFIHTQMCKHGQLYVVIVNLRWTWSDALVQVGEHTSEWIKSRDDWSSCTVSYNREVAVCYWSKALWDSMTSFFSVEGCPAQLLSWPATEALHSFRRFILWYISEPKTFLWTHFFCDNFPRGPPKGAGLRLI